MATLERGTSTVWISPWSVETVKTTPRVSSRGTSCTAFSKAAWASSLVMPPKSTASTVTWG